MELLKLLAGTVIYRPYVYAFLALFLYLAPRHLGWKRALAYLALAYGLAFASELSSTRNGFPFGDYVYIDSTRGRELWISNIPFWDSLSFVFLSYFSWITAAFLLSPESPGPELLKPRSALLGGFLMMLLDVIIDPLTLRGDRWFLGPIYFYPHGGQYFGVPLSNFLGWWLVGAAIPWLARPLCRGRAGPARWELWAAFGTYAGVLAFNLAITGWIGAWRLFACGSAISAAALGTCLYRLLGSRRKKGDGHGALAIAS